MLGQSGVMDPSFVARGEPGRSFPAIALGLPSEAVLESEAVTVSVSLHKGELIIRPSRKSGPGGAYTGAGVPPAHLPPDSEATAVGAAVREATQTAIDVSADVLRPAGSRKDLVDPPEGFTASSTAALRSLADSWLITTRIGARGGGETGAPSATTWDLPAAPDPDDLGAVVLRALSAGTGSDLVQGSEHDDLGKPQLLVEAEADRLIISPQAIDPDTGPWDAPAHSDGRTIFPGATTHYIGTAILLASEESRT